MKLIIFLLILFTYSVAQSQTNGLQSGKYTIAINRATTNVSESWTSVGNIDRVDIKTGVVRGQGTLLVVSINRYFFWFNALPSAANVTQTLTTGAWTIAIPTVVTVNKGIFIPEKFIVVSYAGTKYGIDLQEKVFPLEIRLLVAGNPTGTVACIIYADGTIYWPDLTIRTPTAIGTSGLTNYFIN